MPGEFGGYRPPEATKEQLSPPTELTSEQDIKEFWLAFRRNNGLIVGDPAHEDKTATLQAKQTLREQREGKPAHFFGIKNNEKIVATGKLEIRTKGNGKHGYLSFLAVDENQRGKGLAKQLTDIRTDLARREDCEYVDTDVFTGNPIALVTKFNDGYTLTGLEFFSDDKQAGKFILSKKINGKPEYDKKDGALGELMEIQLSDLSTIKTLLDQGWVGIDTKNLGDEKDKDPKQWKLIMEKRTKETETIKIG